MTQKIRLFYWGIHDLLWLRELCDKMRYEGKLDTCVCIPMGASVLNRNEYERRYGYNCDYFKVIFSHALNENRIETLQYNSTDPLDEQLLEAMLPYESRAIEIGMRRTNVPIVEYTREQQRYYAELRRIKHLYKECGINCFFASAVPHYQDGYIAYCLARIANMPIRFFVPTIFDSRRIIANSLESIGVLVGDCYKQIQAQEKVVSVGKTTSYEITSDDLKKYFEEQTLPLDQLTKIINPGCDEDTKKFYKQNAKKYWGGWSIENQIIRNPIAKYLRLIARLMPRKKECIWSKRHILFSNIIETSAIVRFFMKYYKMSLSEYNKKSIVPDCKKPFILFELQFVPEASTVPQAGVFSSQYVSIQLLAKCAEQFGVDIYVKEHGHLAMRTKHFYDEISLIPNVKFIKTTVSTYELMNKSIAVSSQTGSCLLESVLHGKPALAMGKGHLWKSLPGLIEIHSIKDGVDAIKSILSNEVKINKEDLYKYFCAIDETTVVFRAMNTDSETAKKNTKILNDILDTFLSELS